jgi:hypothetical protein
VGEPPKTSGLGRTCSRSPFPERIAGASGRQEAVRVQNPTKGGSIVGNIVIKAKYKVRKRYP